MWLRIDAGFPTKGFLAALEALPALRYVAEVDSTLRFFETGSETVLPPWSGRGRRPTRRRLAPRSAPAREAREIRSALPTEAWHEISVAEGSQGPRIYRFARVRVRENRNKLPDREVWLLFRENEDGSEPRTYVSNAACGVSLQRLAEVASRRWAIEIEFETLKGEGGLDEYKVRSWRGWPHHIALSLLAGAFLLNLQQGWGKKMPALALPYAAEKPKRQTIPCQTASPGPSAPIT